METVVPFNEMDLPRAQRGVGSKQSEGVMLSEWSDAYDIICPEKSVC